MIINIEDTAKLLKVSKPTIYRWMNDKQDPMPCYKKNGILRFDSDEVLNWFKDKK